MYAMTRKRPADRIEVFAVPGHTAGSAAYLVRGALVPGDSAETTNDGRLEPATWLFCADRRGNRASLRELNKQLATRAGEIRAIACSHSGVLTRGLAPLTELVRSLD
jgi:glyoxylase-like metal-dependent hydrolase (beta-lactamase superfamily II)